VRLVGQMLSMGVAMMLLAYFIGPAEISPEYFPQFTMCLHYAFGIFAVLCILGIGASLMRGGRNGNRQIGKM